MRIKWKVNLSLQKFSLSSSLREQSRKKAAELMRLDKGKEALVYLRQSVDVTHEMALNFIRACRSRNVDCIVAPYEADAQLAYLNIQNIAQVIITEDSDLMLFGAQKVCCNDFNFFKIERPKQYSIFSQVLFKMDINGNGLLIEHENLYLSMGERPENFSFDKFRYMCILSGCDYLPSLPGIGLAKACRFVKRTVDPDIYRVRSPSFCFVLFLLIVIDAPFYLGHLQNGISFEHAQFESIARIQGWFHAC